MFHGLFVLFVFLLNIFLFTALQKKMRRGLVVLLWLAWDSYRPVWPQTQHPACLCFPSVGIKGLNGLKMPDLLSINISVL